MKLTKELFDNLTFEEDFLIMQECEECGATYKNPMEVMEECKECGHDYLINTTSHEGIKCSVCGGYIDMWTDLYKDRDIYVCEDCYDKFETEMNKKQARKDFISEYYKHNPSAN